MLIDYREDTEGTVDTYEFLDQQRADAPGNPIVPVGASMVTWVRFLMAADISADAIAGACSAFRLNGNALTTSLKGNDLVFPGPFGSHGNTGASEQTVSIAQPVTYNVAIPVAPGQTFTIEGQFFGGDQQDVTLGCVWGYNAPRNVVDGPIIKAHQLRQADLADPTESLVALNGDLDGGTSNFTAPPGVSKIGQISYAVGILQAASTRIANQFELDGNGLIVPGGIKPQRWAGVFGQQRIDTEGSDSVYQAPEKFLADYGIVSPRQDIIARAGMIEDDYGTGEGAFVGLAYA